MQRFAHYLPLGIVILLGCTSHNTVPLEITVFRGVDVISMESEAILLDQTVVVKGDAIHEMDSSHEIQTAKSATVIDGTGLYLIPGLAEMHSSCG